MKKETEWAKWNSKEDNFKKYNKIKSRIIYGGFSKKIPDVSIMLLTYKRANKLVDAINSALNQDYDGKYEIVVCDDSGFDLETDKLMKEFCEKHKNIIYYRHDKNLGQYANWNRACELCRTKWYGLLHDDDMLRPNYLSTLMKSIDNNSKIGLIGVYEEAHDTRIVAIKKERVIDKFIDLFIKLNKGKLINLSIRDNIKHIYVMNSTFINREYAKKIGGLDDIYFPSSDFAFSAKMAYYYKTYFLPIKLVDKGIGESESLKQSVCDDSLVCAFNQTYQMCKALGYRENKCVKKASIATVISEIGVRGYNNVDYGKVKESLGINKKYNNRIVIELINIYSKINWGLLLFRRK